MPERTKEEILKSIQETTEIISDNNKKLEEYKKELENLDKIKLEYPFFKSHDNIYFKGKDYYVKFPYYHYLNANMTNEKFIYEIENSYENFINTKIQYLKNYFLKYIRLPQ